MTGDGEFDWRSIAPQDAKAWAGLMAAIAEADQDWEYYSEQDLLEEFSDPYRDHARASVCIYDGNVMVGYCALTFRSTADPVHEMQQEGGVHPAYRQLGLGGRLLDWAHRTAIPLHQERCPGRPLTLTGGCVSHNAGAMALFAAHGYHPARWFHSMERDLSAPIPEISVPAEVRIEGFTPEHIGDALLIRNEAFRDHWGSTEITGEEWALRMEYEAFRPALSFLAYADQEPLGLIISHEYDAYTAASGIRDVHIPLIGTRQQGRKRGIATALVVRVLTQARAGGFTTASLSVDADSLTGALDLYKRVGFTVRHTSIAHTKALLASSSPTG
jgi:mycothiol synthase